MKIPQYCHPELVEGQTIRGIVMYSPLERPNLLLSTTYTFIRLLKTNTYGISIM